MAPKKPDRRTQRYVAHAETMRMIERLVEQGLLGKPWLERPSLAAYSHESFTRIKGRVLARDHYTCQYCGVTGRELTCDHILPTSRGGLDHPDNLVAACQSCNSAKQDKTLEEWLLEPPAIARNVSRYRASRLGARLADYCDNRMAPQFYAFLLLIHDLNKGGLLLSSKTSIAELAALLGCRKKRIVVLRNYGLKQHILLFVPDPHDPGTGWYGISPHFNQWIAPNRGGARAGIGGPQSRERTGTP